VHIGPGATLFGPVRIGDHSKIMAGCAVSESVPPRSVVTPAKPSVRARV
jgi:serine acetyltransferase